MGVENREVSTQPELQSSSSSRAGVLDVVAAAVGELDPPPVDGGATVGIGVGFEDPDDPAVVAVDPVEPEAGVDELDLPQAARSAVSDVPAMPSAVPRRITSRREISERNAALQSAR